MNRTLTLVLAGVLVAVGVLWTLQGLGVVGGSAMSGVRLWAVIGPFVALLGIVVAVGGRKKRP